MAFFSFDRKVSKYLSGLKESKYPRLQAWEYLWDYVQSHRTWKSLIINSNLEMTGLHIAVYLANWGMFRGNASLLWLNLQFFIDLAQFLFSEIPDKFWDLSFYEFNPVGKEKSIEAGELYDFAYGKIAEFEPKCVSWTSTLITKLLMGLWGQCPANDQYFRKGISLYLNEHRTVQVRGRTLMSGQFLIDISQLVEREGWRLTCYKTQKGKNPYPPGKVIDMAFFQFGFDNSY